MPSRQESEAAHRVVSRKWGAAIVRNDTGGVEAVYRAKHSWVASYAARSQFGNRVGTPEDWLVAVGVPIGSMLLFSQIGAPVWWFFVAIAATVGIIYGMRLLAGRLTTGRVLTSGKAITKLVNSGNDELIEAAIDPIIALDTDPAGAAQLVNELRDAWRAAQSSSANEKGAILAALHETARNFPTTDDGVNQVRRELAGVRRSLTALSVAQKELDASTSTADLADPPAPPASLRLLRAASESIAEDAKVVSEVAKEQNARKARPAELD